MTDTQDFEALRLRYLAVGEENDILRYQLQSAEERLESLGTWVNAQLEGIQRSSQVGISAGATAAFQQVKNRLEAKP